MCDTIVNKVFVIPTNGVEIFLGWGCYYLLSMWPKEKYLCDDTRFI